MFSIDTRNIQIFGVEVRTFDIHGHCTEGSPATGFHNLADAISLRDKCLNRPFRRTSRKGGHYRPGEEVRECWVTVHKDGIRTKVDGTHVERVASK